MTKLQDVRPYKCGRIWHTIDNEIYHGKEIARILDLSEGTIKVHCMAIYREMSVSQAARNNRFMIHLQCCRC